MNISELENTLRKAQAREAKALEGGEMEEYRAALSAVLQAERNLSAAKGEQYATPIDFPVSWDAGIPRPFLLRNEYRTFLATEEQIIELRSAALI